jgi:hypothetical protein
MNIPSKSAQFAKSVEVSGQPFDLEEVRRFLRMLAPEETQFQFQTFDDNRDRSARRTNLSRTAFGTFDEHLAWLTEANQRNAAVCVTVNKTLGGRAKQNVTAVRALMLDLDGAPLGPVQACKLRPHVITETSPGHYHAFWRLDGLPIDSFKSCQLGLAERFDGDPGVATLERCARLPGFFHCKNADAPFLVRIVESNDHPAYSADQILAEFPPRSWPHKQPQSGLVLPAGAPLEAAEAFINAHFFQGEARLLSTIGGAFIGMWAATIGNTLTRSLSVTCMSSCGLHSYRRRAV